MHINKLRPSQNLRHFADIFKRIFFNENSNILITISLKFVSKGQINNIPALIQIWTNAVIVYCRIYASLDLSELKYIVWS